MSDNAMRDKVNKETLVWAINKAGWLDPFTQEPLDVRTAVTFEAKSKDRPEESPKLITMLGKNYDEVAHLFAEKYDITDFIDGRNL
jgi:hypothetical protein